MTYYRRARFRERTMTTGRDQEEGHRNDYGERSQNHGEDNYDHDRCHDFQ